MLTPSTSTFSFSDNTKRFLAVDHFLGTLITGAFLIKETCNATDQIDQSVKNFIEEQYNKVNLKNIQDIKIKVGGDPSYLYLAGSHTMYITEPNYNGLQHLLKLKNIHEQNETTESNEYDSIIKGLHIHAALIQHEANHLKNNDVIHNFFVTLAVTFGVEVVYQALNYYLQDNMQTNKYIIDPAQKDWIHIIVSCIIKTTIINIATTLYTRHTEQKADDGIENNKEILDAAKSFFERIHEDVRNKIKWTMGKTILSIHDSFPLLYNLQDLTHPSHISRAKRCEQRLNMLN
jgi:hypothetical protein